MSGHAAHGPDESAVRAALELIVDPCSIATGVPISLVGMGLVKEITSADGHVTIVLRLTSPVCWQGANILGGVEKAVGTLPGVRSIRCVLEPAGEWTPDMMSPAARARLRKLRPIAKEYSP
jgi:metal-sulfur cluster biosynthetic enzyme